MTSNKYEPTDGVSHEKLTVVFVPAFRLDICFVSVATPSTYNLALKDAALSGPALSIVAVMVVSVFSYMYVGSVISSTLRSVCPDVDVSGLITRTANPGCRLVAFPLPNSNSLPEAATSLVTSHSLMSK